MNLYRAEFKSETFQLLRGVYEQTLKFFDRITNSKSNDREQRKLRVYTIRL